MGFEVYGVRGVPKNPGQHVRAFTQIISVALVCFALTACSPETSSNSETLQADSIDLEPYTHVRANLDFETGTVTLPLQAIEMNSPEVGELRVLATRALVDSCLADNGLPTYAWPNRTPEGDDRLYGIWSVSWAASFGYDLPQSADKDDLPPISAEQEACFSAGRAEMEDKLKAIDAVNFDDDVRRAAYAATLASPEGKVALSLAQECMRDRGLSLDSESGFPKLDTSSEYGGEANIRIAVIEATCNVETGAVQALYDLTAQYQTALIDRNEAAAVALAEEKAELVTYFTRLIDENS